MATRPLKQEAQSGEGFSMEDVKKLVQLVERSDVTHIEWEKGPQKVVIKRGGAAPAPAAAAFHPLTPASATETCRCCATASSPRCTCYAACAKPGMPCNNSSQICWWAIFRC